MESWRKAFSQSKRHLRKEKKEKAAMSRDVNKSQGDHRCLSSSSSSSSLDSSDDSSDESEDERGGMRGRRNQRRLQQAVRARTQELESRVKAMEKTLFDVLKSPCLPVPRQKVKEEEKGEEKDEEEEDEEEEDDEDVRLEIEELREDMER
eukprot:evm.model.NODE_37501_length_4681_cov_34.652210.1